MTHNLLEVHPRGCEVGNNAFIKISISIKHGVTPKSGQILDWGPIHQGVEDHGRGLRGPIHQEM